MTFKVFVYTDALLDVGMDPAAGEGWVLDDMYPDPFPQTGRDYAALLAPWLDAAQHFSGGRYAVRAWQEADGHRVLVLCFCDAPHRATPVFLATTDVRASASTLGTLYAAALEHMAC